MLNGKSTPGPWEWKQSRGNNIYEHKVFTQHRVIAELDSADAISPDNHIEAKTIKANARLIAAAPELLEALRMVVDVFNLDRYKKDSGGGKCYIKAQTAIAKAEGK